MDVYNYVYINFGRMAGQGSRVPHNLQLYMYLDLKYIYIFLELPLDVRLRLKIAPAGWHVMLGWQVAGKADDPGQVAGAMIKDN